MAAGRDRIWGLPSETYSPFAPVTSNIPLIQKGKRQDGRFPEECRPLCEYFIGKRDDKRARRRATLYVCVSA
eukprot:1196267-Prorocentrum_minimum.AAC.4